jgi:hypothetical protein
MGISFLGGGYHTSRAIKPKVLWPPCKSGGLQFIRNIMAIKRTLDRTKLLQINGASLNSFLKKIDDSTDGSAITNGMWNKLYACIATVRNIEHVNYWVYTNYLYNYDVHTRKVWPFVFGDDACPIGELKHSRRNSD